MLRVVLARKVCRNFFALDSSIVAFIPRSPSVLPFPLVASVLLCVHADPQVLDELTVRHQRAPLV